MKPVVIRQKKLDKSKDSKPLTPKDFRRIATKASMALQKGDNKSVEEFTEWV